MGKTLAEKIIGEHCGRDVKAGEVVVVDVDLAYIQDGTGPLAVRQFRNMGRSEVFDPERCVVFLDHASPSPRLELSNDHKFLREFCDETGARLSDVGGGISHMVMLEEYVCPGYIVVGADSHTCTGGALGAFATGMGSTDIAFAYAFRKTWLRVPETIKVVARGRLPLGVYGKDLILHLIGKISSRGATYKALEYTGEAIEALSIAGRCTICNMAVEAGAKVGMVPPDEVTRAFLEERGRGDKFRAIASDPDATFERVVEINASELKPTIACPHLVDNVKTIDELGEIKVNEVLIGTSCNGRLEDFQIAADILRGRRVKSGVRLLVTPGSRRVYIEGMADGTFSTLAEAGGVITGPGCGACVGVHEGVLADGDVCLATQPRNFKGRMGNPNAFIYLGSPAVAAATAIEGVITDPRPLLSGGRRKS